MTALRYALPELPISSAFKSEEYKQIREALQAECSGIRPKGWKEQQGWVMAAVHCFMLDMMMRVYAFAETKDDLLNYLGFADITFAHICHHHHFEEEVVFPALVKTTGKDSFAINVEQHHEIATQLVRAWSYVMTWRQNLGTSSKPPVRELVDEVVGISMDGTGLDSSDAFDGQKLRDFMDT